MRDTADDRPFEARLGVLAAQLPESVIPEVRNTRENSSSHKSSPEHQAPVNQRVARVRGCACVTLYLQGGHARVLALCGDSASSFIFAALAHLYALYGCALLFISARARPQVTAGMDMYDILAPELHKLSLDESLLDVVESLLGTPEITISPILHVRPHVGAGDRDDLHLWHCDQTVTVEEVGWLPRAPGPLVRYCARRPVECEFVSFAHVAWSTLRVNRVHARSRAQHSTRGTRCTRSKSHNSRTHALTAPKRCFITHAVTSFVRTRGRCRLTVLRW